MWSTVRKWKYGKRAEIKNSVDNLQPERKGIQGMEKKKYFPIFIDLSEKKIVVIGGGTIAGRRINTLCHFCDRVLVVAPEVTPVVEELVQQEKVTWIRARITHR